jgi:vacuolar-type H+-ATPase subunit H
MGQRTEEQLTTDIAGTREDLAQNLDALNYRVNPSQVMARRKRAARGRLTSMKEKVMGSAQDMRESASSTGSSMTGTVSGTASDAASTLQSKTEGNPLAAGVIAFGAGWLISSLMPASEQEQQAAQRMVETAKEHGQPVIDEAKSVGQEMGENLKEQAGQAADEVKSSAQESAQNVKQEGQSSAETVKSQAPTQS